MKVIIAGSRSIGDYSLVEQAVELSGFATFMTEVVSGAARGVDRLGEQWALRHNIPVKQFPAHWRGDDGQGEYDPSAGLRRNSEMARYADALIALWDGKSPGTKHMIGEANKYGIAPFIYVFGTWVASVNLPKQWSEFKWDV